MATVETRTFSPMTITPATSSITTLAGRRARRQVLDLGDEADHVLAVGGRMATMVGGSSANAVPGKRALITRDPPRRGSPGLRSVMRNWLMLAS
jgi:hypothetical protein